jgi:hypothetical protein
MEQTEMKPMSIAMLASLLSVSVADARAYFFDCGRQKQPGLTLSGQYVRVGVYRVNSVATFEVTIGGVSAADPVRTPVFRWNQKTDKASLDGRQCRMLTDEEVQNLEDPQFADPNSGKPRQQ